MTYRNYDLDKATLIKVDGTKVELTPKGKKFTYDEIREAIGNIIEPLCLNCYPICAKELRQMNMICDEEGAINGSVLNIEASWLLHTILGDDAQLLCGNVIFIPNKLFNVR